MKNIYNLDYYFNSIKYHIYFFDVQIKKSSVTKEALLHDLDIAYMTYKRAKEFDSNAGNKLVSKLEKHFNINTIDYSKKDEYEYTLNDLINRFYYRSDNLHELEPIINKYIEENNYLKPLFLLMILLIRLVKVNDPRSVIDENMELYYELKPYVEKFFVSPFSEMYTIVEILYSGNKLYEVDFSKHISENMRGLVYNSCAVNAFLSKNYSLSLYYCEECRKYLIKEYNYSRLEFINLMYFACLNAVGEYKKCFYESRLQLIYLSESQRKQELINATRIHYYTSCLGSEDYEELLKSISKKDIFNSNDYIFVLLASYLHDKKIYSSFLIKYELDKKRFTQRQKDYVDLIIKFLSQKNKTIEKEKIMKSELNVGLKKILFEKY